MTNKVNLYLIEENLIFTYTYEIFQDKSLISLYLKSTIKIRLCLEIFICIHMKQNNY